MNVLQHPSIKITSDIACQTMEGREEIFYLTMHLTHFIYGYMASQTYGKGPLR